MSELTPNLKLFKYDTLIDGKEVFSINRAMNDNWDKIDSGTVRKTGDTMSGNLIIHRNQTSSIRLDNPTMDYTDTTVPSENKTVGALIFADKNAKTCGFINNVQVTDGTWVTEMRTTRNISGTSKSSIVGTRVSNTGEAWAYCTPSARSGSILTTQAISKQHNGYVLLGNGLQICWGNQTIYKAGTTITFARAFNTAVKLIILQCCYGTTTLGGVGTFETNTGSWTTTGFKANCNVDYCGTTWIAIGY